MDIPHTYLYYEEILGNIQILSIIIMNYDYYYHCGVKMFMYIYVEENKFWNNWNVWNCE